MDNKLIKCSSKIHSEINAISYCQECRVYMCNKCEKFHSELLQNHHSYNLDKNINEIFTGFCKLSNHYELKYYCKNHNQLCCVACIANIKDKENGQHKDCNICIIENIQNEKKNNLKKNILYLDNFIKKYEQSINELKNYIEKINVEKETLKLNIQKIFTKIRNILNIREDELLLEVEKTFNNHFCNENLLKENKNLPNIIKEYLEQGKIIDKEWDSNKLNSNINICINIENKIQDINILYENIKTFNLNNNIKIHFSPDEEEIDNYLKFLKTFGNISSKEFKFKLCPNNIKEEKKYLLSGPKNTIVTKNGTDQNWTYVICDYKLDISKEYKWKIKILKTKYKNILVGVAPFDFDINLSTHRGCGHYLHCYDSTLYSGPPFNYSNKYSNLNQVEKELIVVINLNKKTLKFIINNEDKGESYTDIPLDKPLVPIIGLYNKNDCVEIIKC